MTIATFFTSESITAMANFLGIFATSLAALFSGLNYYSDKKRKVFDETLISIHLVSEDGTHNHQLPGKIRRKNLTRAELQGMLGTVTLEGQRYGLKYLSTDDFFKTLETAQENSETTEIKIRYSADESIQFGFHQSDNQE